MKNKINFIIFRLLKDGIPVGFERFNGLVEVNEYVVGDPTKDSGHVGYKWSQTPIKCNAKEILYVNHV